MVRIKFYSLGLSDDKVRDLIWDKEQFGWKTSPEDWLDLGEYGPVNLRPLESVITPDNEDWTLRKIIDTLGHPTFGNRQQKQANEVFEFLNLLYNAAGNSIYIKVPTKNGSTVYHIK